MRKTGWIAGLLVITATSLLAQQTPRPDKNGVYVVYGEVKPARLVKTAAAVLPPDVSLMGEKHVCTLSVVVGADGIPMSVEVVNGQASPLDDAAIAAVRQSQFEPGTLKGKPVPVRIFVWVPFVGGEHPAIPEAGALNSVKNMTIPKPVNNVEAEFSDEARRHGASGTVLIALVVTEEGLPANVRVVAPFGMGLDEQALKAVHQYRFKPATLEGVPVPVPIVVEVNFRL